MVGRDLVSTLDISGRRQGEHILKIENFRRGNIIKDVSFTHHRGEVLGISGLVGAGRTGSLRAIFGANRADSGQLSVGGPLRPVTIRSTADAIQHRIALVTEDRKGEGLLLSQSIAAIISLGNSDKIIRFSMVNSRHEQNLAQKQIKSLGIRATGSDQSVESLSGGNEQEAITSAPWRSSASALASALSTPFEVNRSSGGASPVEFLASV